MSSASTVASNIQIVQTLCNGSVTASALLSALQSLYPSSGWLIGPLNTLLAAGIKSGIFLKLGSPDGTGSIFWAVNPNALKVNPNANRVYAPYCHNIKGLPCSTLNQTSVTFGAV